MKYQSLIITPVKYENKYLHEYIEHYRAMNFTKILLIDNNDIEGDYIENIYDVIDPNDNFVDVVDNRNTPFNHVELLKRFYNLNYKNYDFICFFDCDEFLELNEKYNNDINNYFDEEWCQKYCSILINWQCYSCGNEITYSNKPLKERNTDKIEFMNFYTKPIINCNNLKDDCDLRYTHNLIKGNMCTNNGKETDYRLHTINYDNAVINHYPFKSVEEYLFKVFVKNNPKYSNNSDVNHLLMYNNMSLEQIKYVVEHNQFDTIEPIEVGLGHIYRNTENEEIKNYIAQFIDTKKYEIIDEETEDINE